MSPVEENLLAHRVVRASRVRSWNVAFHSATPKSGFQVQDLFGGDHFPLAFSGSVRSGFQEQHECIPLSATATETQGTDMHSPMISFPRFGRALVTGHGSFNCCFIIINPNYQGFFSTNPLEESEMTRPSHFSWGFPWCRSYTGRVCLRKPWLRSLPMARSGWDQEHNLDVVFFTLQSFGAVRNMYINAYM